MTSVNSANLIVNPEEGALAVVEGPLLMHYSSSGWTLIAIIQEENARVEKVRAESSCDFVEKLVACTKTKYVLRQTKDETMKALADVVQKESSRKSAAERKVETVDVLKGRGNDD